MALLGRRVAVSIPDTVLEEKESPRDRTAKVGLIARACAIYGVDVIEVYRDPNGDGEIEWICKVLEYLETPQYLRKRIYPLDETLRFAGVLPPLRIPSHKPRIPFASVPVGEVREGVVNADGTVDIGLETAPRLGGRAPAGKRVTVKISSVRPPLAEAVEKKDAGAYWGYDVEPKQPEQVFADSRYAVKVATSRLGTKLPEALGRFRDALGRTDSVKLVFGSPSRGLFDIFGPDLTRRADLVVNLFPGQKVETVRTEEAIFAGLGLLSLLSVEKA